MKMCCTYQFKHKNKDFLSIFFLLDAESKVCKACPKQFEKLSEKDSNEKKTVTHKNHKKAFPLFSKKKKEKKNHISLPFFCAFAAICIQMMACILLPKLSGFGTLILRAREVSFAKTLKHLGTNQI